jgi:hypothetical protein
LIEAAVGEMSLEQVREYLDARMQRFKVHMIDGTVGVRRTLAEWIERWRRQRMCCECEIRVDSPRGPVIRTEQRRVGGLCGLDVCTPERTTVRCS